MQVTIAHLEKPGFFYVRSNWVRATVQLTAEESAIVKKNRLWDKVLVKISQHDELLDDDSDYAYTVKDFCSSKGVLRNFETSAEAAKWAHELRAHIKTLKDAIEYNATKGTTETFDL